MFATRLPPALAPLAELSCDLLWLWHPTCQSLFSEIDPQLYRDCGENPIDLLLEAAPEALEARAQDAAYIARLEQLVAARSAYLRRPYAEVSRASPERPIAFMCAEFALHASLASYSGGLGVLAGDYLKEASDRALPVVGVGLFYRSGYFHQRLDASGWQHEYWTPTRKTHLPIEPVLGSNGAQLTVHVPIAAREVAACVWRARVGRVPLYLLDTDVPENHGSDRFIASHLYVGNRELRLMQYLLLGIGGVRAMRALGLDPSLFHLNEGHAALAAFELLREQLATGCTRESAWRNVHQRLVFTTHTPVAAGNESYAEPELRGVMSGLALQLGLSWAEIMALGHNGDPTSEAFGLTPFALRAAQASNAVSQRHGEVARAMWRGVFPSSREVPITHVTNGVHIGTWMAEPMAALLTRYLGAGWQERAADPVTWEAVDGIPDAELWAVRRQLRGTLVEHLRSRSVEDRMARGDTLEYVDAAARAFDPEVLTVGFARRVASYKRLHLLTRDMARALALLSGPQPIQVVIAGKAHPRDDEAKRIIQVIFGMKSARIVAERVVFLEDYDMASAARIVAGCDVWVNTPRPPLEASGTSGMKAMLNGSLNLSVLDGWWAEAADAQNGWTIQSESGPDNQVQDTRDSDQLYALLERQIVPLFHERDADGVHSAWVKRIKASLRSLAPRFNTVRMLHDYRTRVYPAP